MNDINIETSSTENEKKKRRKNKPYRTIYISNLYVETVNELAYEYSISRNEVIERAIYGQSFFLNNEETVVIDNNYEGIIKGIRSNITQLNNNISYAKELEDDYDEYKKVKKYKNQDYKQVDLLKVLADELEKELVYFINLTKKEHQETSKRLLNIIASIPKDQESRMAKRNSRNPANHKGKSLYIEFANEDVKKKLEELNMEFFNQKKYDNEEDNMMERPSIPATVAQLIRNIKQTRLSYGFTSQQIDNLKEVAKGWNNDVYEMNTAKVRGVQMNIWEMIQQTNALKKHLKELKQEHQQIQ